MSFKLRFTAALLTGIIFSGMSALFSREEKQFVYPDAQPADTLKSVNYCEVRGGLQNCFIKFTREKKGKVAFMGGSITQNPGWRDKICKYLQARFPETAFEFINAGISSTGSTPGAFRLKRDVLDKGEIDLLFEEAAVNDRTNMFDSVGCIRGMEGIVAHALKASPYTDIVLLYFVDPDKMKDYNNGITPYEIRAHEKVAVHYNVTSLNLAKEVTDRINNREFSWEKDFKDLHPSPFGQELYFRSIRTLLEECWEKADKSERRIANGLPKPIDKFSYVKGDYISIEKAELTKGYGIVPNWSPQNKAVVRPMFSNIPVLAARLPGSETKLKFKGRAIGICAITGPDAGIIEYEIDGKYSGTIDLFTQWSSKYNIPWYVVFKDDLPEKEHILILRISAKKNPDSEGQSCYIYKFLVNR